MATRIAAWVLALFALGYTLLLLFFLGTLVGGTPELLVFALLLLPAAAAVYAAFRIGLVLRGLNERFYLLPGLALLCGAGYFGLLFISEPTDGFPSMDAVSVFLGFGSPAILSFWIGGIYLWSGIQAMRGAGQ